MRNNLKMDGYYMWQYVIRFIPWNNSTFCMLHGDTWPRSRFKSKSEYQCQSENENETESVEPIV